MEIIKFCRGSKKLAIKYRYYMKYNLMVALCIIVPIIIFVLDEKRIIQLGRVRASSTVIAAGLLVCLIGLVIGFLGFGKVDGLTYQFFGITAEHKIVHFYFKDMLRDGKVVLHFKPYHKKSTKLEYIDVIKKKEEIIKDENFEEYLCTLCNDPEVQKRSDILFEVMDNVKLVRNTRKYIEIKYTIGQFKTKKKLRIHKNLTNFEDLIQLIGPKK